ncbi:hypothetical protein V1512DRAFT_256644 [Lipomyces arxii]|uniref:uncharacterized protein n=1 Tax=Lipomyces arxii TaxID=56418 RepID=UPI0034D00CEF
MSVSRSDGAYDDTISTASSSDDGEEDEDDIQFVLGGAKQRPASYTNKLAAHAGLAGYAAGFECDQVKFMNNKVNAAQSLLSSPTTVNLKKSNLPLSGPDGLSMSGQRQLTPSFLSCEMQDLVTKYIIKLLSKSTVRNDLNDTDMTDGESEVLDSDMMDIDDENINEYANDSWHFQRFSELCPTAYLARSSEDKDEIMSDA